MVKAKFRVESQTINADGSGSVVIVLVEDGSNEWIPRGKIKMFTNEFSKADKLDVNKEYYLDFSPVPASTKSHNKKK